MNKPAQILGNSERTTSAAHAVAVAFFLLLLIGGAAQAQTFTLLYTFTGGADGGDPEGGLIIDSQGNLYGTTLRGRVAIGGSFSCGTVFQIDKTGKETLLHSFTGVSDGAFPYAGLVRGAQGNLYGVTTGTDETTGTVFKITP